MGYNNKQADYVMDDVNLECVTEEKDLGVIISEDLKCEKQVARLWRKQIECWEWLNAVSLIDLKKR